MNIFVGLTMLLSIPCSHRLVQATPRHRRANKRDLARVTRGPHRRELEWRFLKLRDALETLARETGGLSFFPTADTIGQVLTTINAEITTQYSFGYYANGPATGWKTTTVALTPQLRDAVLRYPETYWLK